MWLSAGARAIWNGRDKRGHYTDADTVAEHYPDAPVCRHACCNGKRPHPKGTPVKKTAAGSRTGKSAVKAGSRGSRAAVPAGRSSAKGKPAPKKRPAAKKKPATNRFGETPWQGRAQTTAQRRATGAAGVKAEYSAYLESQYRAAERATNGYMVTPAGRRAGYSGRDFFREGRRPSVEKWGTEELRAWFGSGSAASTGRRAGRVLTLTDFQKEKRAA